jgi:ribonuclease HI
MSFTPNHDDRPEGDDPDRRDGGLFPASEWIIAYCDGGSRGNPGPAGFGVYIEDGAGRVLAEESEYLGARTNNFAEYSALLAAIEFAISHCHRRLRVIADSELIVKQMKGQYRVNSPELRPLHEQARRRILALEKFEIRHVLREKNRQADRLANLAMDRGMGRAVGPSAPQPKPKEGVGPPAESLQAASRKPKTPENPVPPPPVPRMLRGLVKGGVVHLLSEDLPDGTFVKVIPE